MAFSGAAITATITILSTAQSLPNSLKIGLLLTTIILCICALACSLSFLPRTNLERVLGLRRNLNTTNPDKDNLWFFGHLQKYKPIELLEALNKHYFDSKLNNIPYKKEYQDIEDFRNKEATERATDQLLNAIYMRNNLNFESFTDDLQELLFKSLSDTDEQ
ncbi:hypothetical protein [Anabaena sp. AL93]|uniref:hypothetical protein n=1 Tax=Anabaena sp. AL93 TaxID=1678133 RepID=UPI0025BE1DBC|nr:hypothetical protein [Anabaena sp. AL93]MCX5980666.1 hypothetical protein [Nostocales cyanobacterium LacPavin_0920_SED1_MAG_38_18]